MKRLPFITALVVGLIAGGCASTVSLRDLAVELGRDVRMTNEVFFRSDSICSAITVTHPLFRDDAGELLPFTLEKCWPLAPSDPIVPHSSAASDSLIGAVTR